MGDGNTEIYEIELKEDKRNMYLNTKYQPKREKIKKGPYHTQNQTDKIACAFNVDVSTLN